MPLPDDLPRLSHAEQTALLDNLLAKQQATHEHLTQLREQNAVLVREQNAVLDGTSSLSRPPTPLPDLHTTLAQARAMTHPREAYPTWMHAAYADLAQRLDVLTTAVLTMQEELAALRQYWLAREQAGAGASFWISLQEREMTGKEEEINGRLRQRSL